MVGLRRCLGVALLVATVVTVSSCSVSVSGSPTPQADLAALALPADDFPYGPAVVVDDRQLPYVLADVAGRPLQGEVAPADCLPAELPATDAVALTGPGAVDSATLTEVVVRPGQSLNDFADWLERCEEYQLGTSATTRISQHLAQRLESGGVPGIELVRTQVTGGAGSEVTTTVTALIAQSGAVRLYVVDRRLAGSGPQAEQRERFEATFETAVARAFG